MTWFVHSNHWLSLVINSSSHLIYFGDSFGRHEAPDLIHHAVEWWLALHTSVLFEWQPLACTRQQDRYSCGILAINAIAHHFLPESYPLLSSTCDALDGAQMQIGVAVIDTHLHTLSQLKSGEIFLPQPPSHAADFDNFDDFDDTNNSDNDSITGETISESLQKSIHKAAPAAPKNSQPVSDQKSPKKRLFVILHANV
ncbi:hypothetical protein BDR07DRAFT_1556169 [Suillus spraguei]|nr:hypothetical protein BDR07DRAFT_1556169 [Suillus spraguei]